MLGAHPLFARLTSLAAVRVFMAHHVWAVWDFMSLLKSIQAAVAPVRVPWVPAGDAESARLINEIVAAEEGDVEGGSVASHFEIYLAAMDDADADSRAIRGFVAEVSRGVDWRAALVVAPPAAQRFVESTMEIVEGSLVARVAAFTVSREDAIPRMFSAILATLGHEAELRRFRWYLERHVEIDDERHGPMAARLYERICGPHREQAEAVAASAVAARLALWDGIARAL